MSQAHEVSHLRPDTMGQSRRCIGLGGDHRRGEFRAESQFQALVAAARSREGKKSIRSPTLRSRHLPTIGKAVKCPRASG